MCRTKKNGKSKKGLKTLQWTATLSTLRQNSECGVANVKTTAGCNQLFSFCAWPEQKICFRYAVVVAPVVVLKVSNYQTIPDQRNDKKQAASKGFPYFLLLLWNSSDSNSFVAELHLPLCPGFHHFPGMLSIGSLFFDLMTCWCCLIYVSQHALRMIH